jgi:rod shape-determining protein MreC
MDNLLTRHRNVSILVAVLFAQVLGLAVQVKRASSGEDTRLVRIWAVEFVTPLEKGWAWMQHSSGGLFHNYVYLRGVRAENRELKQQIEVMRVQQVRLAEDAEQARRLQLLLGFKEKFIQRTVPAQVIGTSGTDQSRSVYIDKGWSDGIKPDQAVITAEGIVGKILHIYDDHTSNLLLVNDQSSGVGVILEKSRLQGILRGTANGQLAVEKIMSDESVQPGERVLTSGGDQIFPKGLQVGEVTGVKPGKDGFLEIRIRPTASLSKLEEVLVITQIEQKSPSLQTAGSVRAVDILTQRLPSVPEKPAVEAKVGGQGAGGQGAGTAKAGGQGAGGQGAGTAKIGGQAAGAQGAGTPAVGAQGTGGQGVAKPGVGTNPTVVSVKPKSVGPASASQSLKPTTTDEQLETNNTANTPTGAADTAQNSAGSSGPTVPKPSPQLSPAATHAANGTAAAPVPAPSASVKPTSGSGASGTAVKPAVVQSTPSKKTGAPTANPPDKSANPATATKPQTAPAEDKPE